MVDIHEFLLPQDNYWSFDTLTDALDNLTHLVPGVRVYIISEDKFYYYKNDVDEFVPEDQSMGADDQTAAEVEVERISGSTFSTVQHAINLGISAGSLGESFISDAGSETIDVASGQGFIRDADSDSATIYFFDWSQSLGISIPTDTIRYVGIDYNAGSPQVIVKISDIWDFDTNFPLGTVVNEAGNLYIINNSWKTIDSIANILEITDSLFGVTRDNRLNGLIISNTGTRNVAITAGSLLARFSEFPISAIDTSGADTFDAYFRDGSGGFTKQASQTQWNNTQYDDGSGTLQSLTTDYYTARWFYVMTDGTLAMVYGTAEYEALAEVLSEDLPTVPDRISKLGLLIGRIVAQEGTDTPANVATSFGTPFSGTDVSLHNELGGIQGGLPGDRQHLSTAQVNRVDFDYAQTIFVGKHGDNSNDGFSPGKAKLTFTDAITAASALTPSDTNRIAIICEDGGTYNEGISVPSFVHVFAPNVTLIGAQIVADSSSLKVRALSSVLPTVLQKTTGSGIAYVEFDELIVSGNIVPILLVAGDLFVNCKYIEFNAMFGIVSVSSGHLHVDIDELVATNAALSGAVAIVGGGSGFIRGRIGNGRHEGTSGTFFNVANTNGAIRLEGSLLETKSLYTNTVDGELDLNYITITESANSVEGTVFASIRTSNEPQGGYFMNSNATATVINTQGVFVKINGTTTALTNNNIWTHQASNRINYNGFHDELFNVEIEANVGSAISGLKVIEMAVFVNGVIISNSVMTSSRAPNVAHRRNLAFSARHIRISPSDFVEIFIANTTNTDNLIVEDLKVSITKTRGR